MSEGDQPYFSIVEAIIFDRQIRTSEENFGQRQRNAMLGAIDHVLRRIEAILHDVETTPMA